MRRGDEVELWGPAVPVEEVAAAAGTIRRQYQVKRWIACRLVHKEWHRSPLLQPGKFTELFFLDEATALAAGHRPCALCRHDDYTGFADAWRDLHGDIGADAIDVRLHDQMYETTAVRRPWTSACRAMALGEASKMPAPAMIAYGGM